MKLSIRIPKLEEHQEIFFFFIQPSGFRAHLVRSKKQRKLIFMSDSVLCFIFLSCIHPSLFQFYVYTHKHTISFLSSMAFLSISLRRALLVVALFILSSFDLIKMVSYCVYAMYIYPSTSNFEMKGNVKISSLLPKCNQIHLSSK